MCTTYTWDVHALYAAGDVRSLYRYQCKGCKRHYKRNIYTDTREYVWWEWAAQPSVKNRRESGKRFVHRRKQNCRKEKRQGKWIKQKKGALPSMLYVCQQCVNEFLASTWKRCCQTETECLLMCTQCMHPLACYRRTVDKQRVEQGVVQPCRMSQSMFTCELVCQTEITRRFRFLPSSSRAGSGAHCHSCRAPWTAKQTYPQWKEKTFPLRFPLSLLRRFGPYSESQSAQTSQLTNHWCRQSSDTTHACFSAWTQSVSVSWHCINSVNLALLQ